MRASTKVAFTCAAGLGTVMFDNSAMIIALPAIGSSLDLDVSAMQWLMSAMNLTAAVTLPVSGVIGDRYGARKGFRLGLALFAVGAVFVALSQTFPMLIAGRVIEGCGVALLLPNGVALLAGNIPLEKRSRAVATWITIGSAGLILGPLGGGWVTQHIGWRYLVVGHLLALSLGLVGTRSLRETNAKSGASLDVLGLITISLALFSICWGLIEAGKGAENVLHVAFGVGGGGLLAGLFVIIERRAPHPLLDFALFGQRQFTAVLTAAVLYNATVTGGAFLLSLLLQGSRSLSPTIAGAILMGATLGMPFGGQVTGLLANRTGLRILMSTAAGALTLGYILVSVFAFSSLVILILPLALTGLAGGVLFAADTLAVLHAVSSDKATSGLAMLSLARQIGSVAGIAVLGSLTQTIAAWTTELPQGIGVRVGMLTAGLIVVPGVLLLWRHLEQSPPSPA